MKSRICQDSLLLGHRITKQGIHCCWYLQTKQDLQPQKATQKNMRPSFAVICYSNMSKLRLAQQKLVFLQIMIKWIFRCVQRHSNFLICLLKDICDISISSSLLLECFGLLFNVSHKHSTIQTDCNCCVNFQLMCLF